MNGGVNFWVQMNGIYDADIFIVVGDFLKSSAYAFKTRTEALASVACHQDETLTIKGNVVFSPKKVLIILLCFLA